MEETSATPQTLSVRFRNAMRRLAANVTIVTTRESGMTATAVTSLSSDPLSILTCVNRSASIHATLRTGTRFCVNVLAEEQIEVAHQCSGALSPAERFLTDAWRRDAYETPYLPGAAAAIFCVVDTLSDYGSHTIVIGRVAEVMLHAAPGSPLIYVEGRFAATRALEA